MDELIRQAVTILRGAWQRRWVGMAAAWAVGIIGAVVLLKIPDRFDAAARVNLDTQSILRPLMSGLAVQPDPSQQINLLARTLISRPNMEKLVESKAMQTGFRGEMDRESVIDHLIKTVKLTSSGRENLFTISYRDTDPLKAKAVVDGLVAFFLEASLGDKRKDADQAQRFIDEQVKAYEARLLEAENRLKEFKLRNMGVVGSDGKDYFGRMAEANEEIQRTRTELRSAMESRDALRRELVGETPILLPEPPRPVQPSAVVVPEIDGRLDTLRKQLDELLRKFTERHPDVIGTKRIIEQLEAERRVEAEKLREAERRFEAETKKHALARGPLGTGIISGGVVIERLKIAVAEAEANIAALSAKLRSQEARSEQLRALAQRLPQVEAELTQLNRDYEIQKKNYESLVSRRESAAISGNLGEVGGLASFQVVDPPHVSPTPVAPNRKLLLPIVLLVACAGGALVSFVLSQLAPTLHDARMLREIGQRPVLGTVSMLINEDRIRERRRGNFAFLGALAALFCVYGGVFVMLTASAPTV